MNNREEELAEKLQWLADYNQGKREMPPFTREEMIEVRTYQLELSKVRMEKLLKKNGL